MWDFGSRLRERALVEMADPDGPKPALAVFKCTFTLCPFLGREGLATAVGTGRAPDAIRASWSLPGRAIPCVTKLTRGLADVATAALHSAQWSNNTHRDPRKAGRHHKTIKPSNRPRQNSTGSRNMAPVTKFHEPIRPLEATSWHPQQAEAPNP